MQDNFEIIDKNTIIIPNENFYVKNYELTYSKLRKIFKNIIKVNFYFEGGNLTVAKIPNNETIFFLGYGSIEKTASQVYKEKYQNNKQKINKKIKQQIKDFIKQKFNSRIVFLGNKIESKKLIHIDQAMLFLNKNNVILMDYDGEKFLEVKRQLKNYENQLKELGFNILKLKHTDRDIAEKKFSLNSVIYKNGRKKIAIFPVYPNEHNGKKIQGKALELKEILKKFNYKIKPFFDDIFYKFGGSIHCLTNIY